MDAVHESPVGIWVLSGYSEVAAALRHPKMGSDETKADISAIRLGPFKRLLNGTTRDVLDNPGSANGDQVTTLMRQLMLFRDPPDHTRLRSMVNKAFTAKAIAALEEGIRQVVHDRLDQIEGFAEMDFLTEFAYPIPALVICELMGVPSTDHELIARHAPAVAARLDPSPMRNPAVIAAAAEATEALTSYLSEVIATRRERKGGDVLSALLAVEEEGDRLSHDELVAMTLLLLIAGHETTANLLANGLLALLNHPRQWNRYKRDASLDHTAIEELLRFDGPIQMAERITLDDVEIGGARIPKGRIVVLCLAAANRDPAAFAKPDDLDLSRDPNPHLAFSAGPHFCLGAPLARLETRVALRAVAERLPNLTLQTPVTRWRRSFTIRGLTELRLAW